MATDAAVVTYPAPPEITAATAYRVQAGGKEVFAYPSPFATLAVFSFTGAVPVTVTADQPIQSAIIRPTSLGIRSRIEGNTLRFTLRHPCNLSIELNGDTKNPLFLFANPPERDVPKPGDPNVLYFAGGKVYEAGEITLKDGMTVYLGGGAVVRGVIRAKGVRNARVIGRGILDATPRTTQTRMISLVQSENIELNGIVVLGSYGWTIVPDHSRDIRLNNVKVVSGRANDDGIDVVSTKDLTVDGCFLRTMDDCIAVKAIGGDKSGRDDVQNVQVRNSVFWNANTGNALEIGFELRAARVGDILFKNCDIIRVETGSTFSIHNGDTAAVENVRFEDIRVEDAREKLFEFHVGLSIYSVDCPREYSRVNPKRKPYPGGPWLRLTADEVNEHLDYRGRINNVTFKNIRLLGDKLPKSYLVGFGPEHNVANVTFENVTFQGKPLQDAQAADMVLENAEGVRFLPAKERK